MWIRSMTTLTAVLLVATSVANGQGRQSSVDRAFKATGTECSDIEWSQEMLEQYPNIAEACQEVLQREGKTYVKFQGEVRRVRDRGRELTVDFQQGGTVTLTPPEGMTVYINGRSRPVSQLRPGDELNFYVPEDRVAAQFFEGEPTQAAKVQEVPILMLPPQRVAAAPEPAQAEEGELPVTASPLPMLGLAGLLLTGLGAALTFLRIRRREL